MERDVQKRFEQIETTLKDTNDVLNGAAKVVLGLTELHLKAAERSERIERHLEVLITVVDDLIADRRLKALEARVALLEEQGGGKAA